MGVTVADTCNGGRREDFAWPPGFRFHPTDEELVLYYLKRKICRKKLKLDIIRVADVYKWNPEELPEQSLLKTGDRLWFFFSPRDRKYPNGARSNRATRHGYWKATGKDRIVTCYSRNVGLKKTLVFYRGRAPSGERTDWVMHEYTMDEEELGRCQNVKDYYALYKVFKKSGPGPKNGEQYGAPFREEDWVDGECEDAKDSVAVHSSATQHIEAAAPDCCEKMIVPVEQSVDDLDELLKHFVDEPELDLSPLGNDSRLETQTHDNLADSALTEVTFPKSFTMLPPSDQQIGTQVNFEVNQAGTSILPSNGRPEVLSANNNFGEPLLTLEDFLEMDDLIESQSTVINGAGENLRIDIVDGNHSINHFLDPEMLFSDDMFTRANMIPIGNEMENHLDDPTMRYSVGHQEVAHLQTQSGLSDVNYQFQPESFFGDEISNQLEMHDQANGVLYSGTPSTLAPAPGGEHEVGSGHPTGSQNPSGQQGASATNSRFASSMWAFLESIPSAPASASESILTSRTFERMSSFSKLRMNPKNPVANEQNVAGNAGKAGVSRYFVVLSVLVALCAILWVVMSGTVKVFARSISS